MVVRQTPPRCSDAATHRAGTLTVDIFLFYVSSLSVVVDSNQQIRPDWTEFFATTPTLSRRRSHHVGAEMPTLICIAIFVLSGQLATCTQELPVFSFFLYY